MGNQHRSMVKRNLKLLDGLGMCKQLGDVMIVVNGAMWIRGRTKQNWMTQ